MKHFKKLYPTYYNSLFIFYTYKEKRSTILLFLLLFTNIYLAFWVLPQGLPSIIWGFVIMLDIAILAKVLFDNSLEYNKRVLREYYGIEIKYTKAFRLKFYKMLFLTRLVNKYPKYEDLIADYDEDYQPNNLNIGKKFNRFLLLLCSLIAFIGTFLLDTAPLNTKITYLALILAFVLIPIVFIYLQFSPIAKEMAKDRYKKNKLIIDIIEEIKKTIAHLPPKYVASNDLKSLILNSDLIDEPLRPFFQLSNGTI